MHKNLKFGVSFYGVPGRNKMRVYKLRFDANVDTRGIEDSLFALKLADWVDLWTTEYKGKTYNNICFACSPMLTENDYKTVKAIIKRFKNLAIAQDAINKVREANNVILP
jgi:hypothetical protein